MFNYCIDQFDFGEHIRIFETRLAKSLDKHTHDFIEIAYIRQGEVWHTINNRKSLLKKGDFVIIDYGTAHSFDLSADSPVDIINCLFTPNLIDMSLKDCRSMKQLLNNYLITYDCIIKDDKKLIFHDSSEEILNILKKIKSEYMNKYNGYLQLIRSNLIEIIIVSMRKYQAANSMNSNDSNYDAINLIERYISGNYNKNISLNEIAGKLNLSANYVSHFFKKNTGITISDYIQKARINNACRLLLNTDYKVSEISHIVGYNDYKFFNEIFRKHINSSPLQYKKMNRLI
ncbi:MAG: AraC family transcriptional regulator [Saccharofermentanales bacterium]